MVVTEYWIIGAFCLTLVGCLVLKLSMLYALLAGLILFWLYGRRKGFSWRELAAMAFRGVWSIRKMLTVLLLIGILTAFWRASGTIPYIVWATSGLIRPSVLVLMAFLLNAGMSMLTGTAFGTAATMGSICVAIAAAMGVDLRFVGGAVLAGVYFGDRCSPLSTSALLVAELTHTDIYDNVRHMVRTALVPLGASCAVYLLLGHASAAGGGAVPDLGLLFRREFALHWAALIPALVILLLSALRTDVRLTMTASLAAALAVCFAVEQIPPAELGRIMLFGYRAEDARLAAMINGGGIFSMARVACILCITASYSEILQRSGLLRQVKGKIAALSRRSTPFVAILSTALLSALVACNQTLTIILTDQLCDGLRERQGVLAEDLEDTAVIVAPLIPWSIACTVPLSSAGAPPAAIPLAVFLFFVPMWRTILSLAKRWKLRHNGEG